MKLHFQDSTFSWKFLLAKVAFPILGVDFLRFHKMLINPTSHALPDSMGRRLNGLAHPSLPTATEVVGFVQPYSPISVISGPRQLLASTGLTSTGLASTGLASTGPASP
jgi:hypothetical protein